MSHRLAAITCLFAFVLSAGYVATHISKGVDTNILSLLPGDARDPVLADALQRASAEASNRVAFAIEGGTAQQRAVGAVSLTRVLETTGYFRSSAHDAKEIWQWLFAHRAVLLCPDDRKKLEEGQGAGIARQALADWYAPVTPGGPDMMRTDPFLRTNRLLACLLSNGAHFMPKGDAQIVSGSITSSVFRLDVQDKIGSAIAQWQGSVEAKDLRLSRAGAIFHAAYGAEHARSEMSVISGLTTVAVLFVYWFMFRSLRAPVIAVTMVLFSLVIGLALSLAVFGSVHAMALVFGAALIGMVVDYTTYYLVTGLAEPDQTPTLRKARIFRPLTLGMLTSVAAFAALFFFPVEAFQQIALFGSVGLVAAWSATLVLTPLVEGRAMQGGPGALWTKDVIGRFLGKRFTQRAVLLGLGVAVIAIFIVLRTGNTLDDVRRFQAPSPSLVVDEAHMRSLTGFAPSGTFYLIRGATRDEATMREETLLAALDAKGQVDSVSWAASRFDPSTAMQVSGAKLFQDKLVEPYLAQTLNVLGGGNTYAYADTSGDRPSSAVQLPGFVSGLRGKTNGVFWSIAPVSGAANVSLKLPGVQYVDPAQRYSDLFRQYRELASFGLLGAVIATGLMLMLVYRSISSLRMLVPTAIALVMTPVFMSLMGLPFSFFSVMGLFLVAGAGVDYAIFQWENPGKDGDWARVGIVLAATMTCISVGLLGLSSVLPVRSFGLTVALGILMSLLLSPLVRGWVNSER